MLDRIIGWGKDRFIGFPDERIVFNDLSEDDRRREEKRREHLQKKISHFARLKNVADIRASFVQHYHSWILQELHEDQLSRSSQSPHTAIAATIASSLPDDFSFTSEQWRQLLHLCGRDKLITTLAPGLFNGEVDRIFTIERAARERRREEERARAEVDKAIVQKIHELRATIRQSKEMATKYAMEGDTMSFAPWIFRLEAAQSAIYDLKKKLSSPIPSSWEDTMRTGG